VDTDLFCPENIPEQRKNVRAGLNIPENAFLILQVASLSPEKRHEDAFTALDQLIDEDSCKDIFLVLVGDGPEKYKLHLKDLANQLGISKNVIFCGAQDDVKKFYSAADMFTLTSSTEAFSVAALEAMAMGLPCVITDVGGAREMILEGTNGFLVEPNNPRRIAEGWSSVFKMKDALDPQKIRSWTVKHFSLRTCVHQYEKLLIQ
jgi:glycosyltransferase involved in cell wall biosynthesis